MKDTVRSVGWFINSCIAIHIMVSFSWTRLGCSWRKQWCLMIIIILSVMGYESYTYDSTSSYCHYVTIHLKRGASLYVYMSLYVYQLAFFFVGGSWTAVTCPTRIIVCFLLFAVMVILATYSSNLMASLSVAVLKIPFKTLREVIKCVCSKHRSHSRTNCTIVFLIKFRKPEILSQCKGLHGWYLWVQFLALRPAINIFIVYIGFYCYYSATALP